MVKYVYAALILFSGCAPSLNVENDKYTDSAFKDMELTFFPITKDALRVQNPQDVLNSFPDDTRSAPAILRDSLLASIVRNSMARLQNITFVPPKNSDTADLTMYDTSKFHSVMKGIDKQKIPLSFFVPSPEVLSDYGIDSDIVYLINEIDFKRESSTVDGSTLMSTVKYIVWHAKQEEAVSYGQFNVTSAFGFSLSKTWTTHFNRLTEALYSHTPFSYRTVELNNSMGPVQF